MAYNPTNWECGDVVTAELLNKLEEAVEDLSVAIEGGSGSEPMVIKFDHEDESTGRTYYDKTFQEVYDAMLNGTPVYLQTVNSKTQDVRMLLIENTEVEMPRVACYRGGSTQAMYLKADSQSDYLYFELG